MTALAEAIRNGLSDRHRVFTINMEITGLCNAHCTYCHFYNVRDREEYAFHLPEDLFEAYCHFIKYWGQNADGETNYRFSGGDPIVMKDLLFDRANRAYEISDIRPFVLTHGKGLTQRWIDKAKDSAIQNVYFSIENPICPDPGALAPQTTIDNLKRFNSDELPLVLGVCVVPNEAFQHLLEICDWFYDRIGYIPPIAEVNYASYKNITEDQWKELDTSIDKILQKYHGVTHLNLFHSVSPELGYYGADPYIFNLDLENKFDIDINNIEQRAFDVAENLKDINYPYVRCSSTDCTWNEFCVNTKWYWHDDGVTNPERKIQDYCRFKRIMNDNFYRHAVDINHKNTEAEPCFPQGGTFRYDESLKDQIHLANIS